MKSHAPAHTHVPAPYTGFEATRIHLTPTAAAHVSAGAGGGILRTVVALAIVIAVIYGLTWLVRKLKGRDVTSTGEGLERVASLPLGAGQSVALVRVGSELHLLGVGAHTVCSIHRFSEDEAVEAGLPVAPPGTPGAGRAGALRRAGLGLGLGGLRGVSDPDGRARTLDTLRRLTQR
jgi:flagellar biosynthetic protein FliO